MLPSPATNLATSSPPRLSLYQPNESSATSSLVFASIAMKRILKLARKFARSSGSILICGESGTGKELISRMIHQESPRCRENLVAVNCAAVPELLVESEFFGHARGAFTGAVSQRKGHFELADKGTLMLDEISETSQETQSKLLRVLEERMVQPVGSTQPRFVDVRVVATTNRPLRQEVDEGRFRLDLFHRLSVLCLEVPPLRERPADIELFAKHFVEKFRFENETNLEGVSIEAMKKLAAYHWPGNVREIRNVIHRACIVAEGPCIQPMDIQLESFAIAQNQEKHFRGKSLRDVEKILILDGLSRLNGNKEKVAKELGISKRTLNNKLARYREEEKTGEK